MSPTVYFLTLCLILGTILAVFGMKYFSAAARARAGGATDEAYRALAEKAVTAQAENAASLAAISGELSNVIARLGAVEKILKDVE